MQRPLSLEDFYRAISELPATEAELGRLGRALLSLLDVQAVGVSIPGFAPKLIFASGFDRAENLRPELAMDVIRSKVDPLVAQSWSRGEGCHILPVSLNLDLQKIRVWLCVAIEQSGWIFIGSSRALDRSEQDRYVAAAQYLRMLLLQRDAKAALLQRDQFLSIASHELKTPLTSIYGVLQLQERVLRQKRDAKGLTPDEEKQHGFFQIVIRQVQRLNELIDALLDVSRIQVGRFMVEPSEVNASSLVQETVGGRLSFIAKEAGVTLHVETPPDLMAWIDPVRFEEVITNLGMNAVRFSPEGGAVWIRLYERADSSLVLEVRDQGPSIPADDRERIFQPFERAQRTSRLGGLGLGLFISRQIAQLHGGSVDLVESLSGKGNRFEAWFPSRAKIQRLSAIKAVS